jgi:membrane protein
MRIRDLGEVFKQTGVGISKNDGDGLAAQAAFNFAFSLFPLLLLAFTLLGMFSQDEKTRQTLVSFVGSIAPADTAEMVRQYLLTLDAGNLEAQLSLSLILVLWPASRVFNAFIKATMLAYGAPDKRPFWKNRLIAIGLVLLTAVLGGLSFLAMIFAPLVGDLLAHLGLGEAYKSVFEVMRFPLAVMLMAPVFALIYRFGPDCDDHSKTEIWPGALLATFLWVTISALFSLYVANFANYNATYGALGGLIILLSWMYLSSFSVIIGAEFNAAFGAWLRKSSPTTAKKRTKRRKR